MVFSGKYNLNDKEIMKKLHKILFKSMLKMHEIAVRLSPVDTGRLRNSITLNPLLPMAKKYILGTNLEYSRPVEYGTWKMDAQPYMRPALFQVKNVWVKRFMKQEFKK